MTDTPAAPTPKNIRILYVGPGINRVQPGDVFAPGALASLGVVESDLLSRGDAELTEQAPTVEIELEEKRA